MAALLQKEKVFLIGSSLLLGSVSVKILGSFHKLIIACGMENVQQKIIYVN